MTVDELLGSFERRIVIGAVQVNGEFDAVGFAKDIGAVAVAFHGGGSEMGQ